MIPTIQDTKKLLYEQVYDFYRDAILQKRLKHNQRLPSYRKLAKELGISNNTVLRAYELLIAEGYVRNESRRGLYVMRMDYRDWQLEQPQKTSPGRAAAAVKKAMPAFDAVTHMVDESHFPGRHWRKCSNWALDRISFQYEEHEPDDPLKEQLIKYLLHYRGVQAGPERLLIGSGTSALIFWLAFLLQKECARIVVEDPGYPRTRQIFSSLGFDLKPVSVNRNGIDVEKLMREKADLLYLTPSHQYPTGAAIPVTNRLKILEWAVKNNAYVIEDDFDCEFRYKTKLMPSLQGLDTSGRVVYSGTFSSALMPSLRVAYLVLPEHFPADYTAYRYLINTVPYVIRKTLAIFMEKGFWERHLKKMRIIYKKKYDACIEALKELPRDHLQWNHAPSGLNILLRINTELNEEELIRRSQDAGIKLTPASGFYYQTSNKPDKPEVLLEFGSLPPEEVGNIIRKVYAAWFETGII
jgi:GntR family transcriptional regulator/MocR family aminotransferase